MEVEGVKIFPYDTMTRSYPIEFGHPDPKAGERKTLKEIWDIIIGEITTPDCVIQERASIVEPPKRVPDQFEDIVDGVDEFYQIEQGKGWRKRVAGVPCVSVQRMMKNELMSKGIIKKTSHPAFKRMRGVLLTAFVLPAVRAGNVIDIKGWQVLGNVDRAHGFQRILRAGKFWQDTAVPWRFIAEGDSITGYIYRLESRNKLLGI